MWKFISASFLALLVFQSHAAPQTLLCNYCDSYQMKSRAMSHATEGGKVNLINAIDGTAKSFMVFREENMVMIQPTTTSQSTKETASAAKQVYSTLETDVSKGIEWESIAPFINDPRLDSAYDLATSQSYRYTVEQALVQRVDGLLGGELASVVSAAGLAFANSLIAGEAQFTLTFPDGTTYTFAIKGITYNVFTKKAKVKIEAVKYSGRDGDIVIPQDDSFQNYFERHGHTIDELYDLLEHLRTNGVNVSVSSNIGNGNPVVVICDVMKNCAAMPE